MKSKFFPLIVILLAAFVFSGCTLKVNPDEDQKSDHKTTDQAQDKVKAEKGNAEEDTERMLLTPSNLSNYNSPKNPKCDEVFNSDTANQTVEYKNLEKGLSVQIPYNQNWGNDQYRINPYDEHKDYIAFGPIYVFEACSWIRSYSLNFLPIKSAQEVMAGLDSRLLETKPGVVNIGDLTAVKYVNGGLCSYPTYQVIGKLNNYELVPTCGTASEKEFAFMEDVLKSVKLIGDAKTSDAIFLELNQRVSDPALSVEVSDNV